MIEPLIQRYEHRGFTGWVVSATRRNKPRDSCDRGDRSLRSLHYLKCYRNVYTSTSPMPVVLLTPETIAV